MGTLKLTIKDITGQELTARKLDPNDPEVKRIINQALKDQEAILKLKHITRESLMQEITI